MPSDAGGFMYGVFQIGQEILPNEFVVLPDKEPFWYYLHSNDFPSNEISA
jgi:hypothetical protein